MSAYPTPPKRDSDACNFDKGNVDEWVWRDRSAGVWRSALKGGWWMPGRDRCRAATTAHDEDFHGLQTGFRCCADTP